MQKLFSKYSAKFPTKRGLLNAWEGIPQLRWAVIAPNRHYVKSRVIQRKKQEELGQTDKQCK